MTQIVSISEQFVPPEYWVIFFGIGLFFLYISISYQKGQIFYSVLGVFFSFVSMMLTPIVRNTALIPTAVSVPGENGTMTTATELTYVIFQNEFTWLFWVSLVIFLISCFTLIYSYWATFKASTPQYMYSGRVDKR